MRICTGCEEAKELAAFASRGGGKLHSRCRDCQNLYSKGRYASDPKRHAAGRYKHKINRRRELQALVAKEKDRPCMDCGNSFPTPVMEYDHRPGEVKVADISALVASGRRAALMEELGKCDVVCANCHRIRTFGRRNGE